MSDVQQLPVPWPCTVRLYGNDYTGNIVKWGKTRATVQFRTAGGELRERCLPIVTTARPKEEKRLRIYVTPGLPRGFSGGGITPRNTEALARAVLNTSLRELVEAKGTYRPTIMVRHAADLAVADAYDREQIERGDPRRAYRGRRYER